MLRKDPAHIFLILFLAVASVFIFQFAYSKDLHSRDYSGEKIVYSISPLGRAEYADLGLVELAGQKLRLMIFKTQVLWLDDTEKIYAEPDTLLPVKIERDVSTWFGREYIVEEYDQKKFLFTMTKFKGGKKVEEHLFREKGPVHNAILLAFYPRLQQRLDIGWNFEIRVPAVFRVKLVSIDEVSVPAGKFKAYHFVSYPDKFEVWVKKDEPRMPLIIKGNGGLGYSLFMKEYIPVAGGG